MSEQPAPKLSVIVVSHNSARDLSDGLAGMVGTGIELIVVDNASHDGSAEVASTVPGTTVTALPVNVGWSRGCNIGAGQARAPVLAFVNPDASPTARQLLHLASALGDPSVGSVSPRFVADGKTQSFYFRFPRLLTGVFCVFNAGQRIDVILGGPFIRRRTYDFGRDLPVDVDQPGAACLLVRTRDFQELGGFDDDLFLFFADTDLCLRLANTGRRAFVDWSVDVPHVGEGSVQQLPTDWVREVFQRDYLHYVRRHSGYAAMIVMKVMAVLLTGVAPACVRLVRGRPMQALSQLRLARAVVR